MSVRITPLGAAPLISLLFRLFLGIIFLYAGFIKIVDPLGFAQALYNYRILPGWMINPVAIILPWVELVTGGSLFLGIWTLGGGLVALSLLGVFALALGINLARGVDISCGCFSTSSTASPNTWFHLVRDLILFGMGLAIVLFDQRIASLERLFRTKSRSPRASAG
jgi:uncharacterized membrane protein YphA (DoxX/SURF4 family)